MHEAEYSFVIQRHELLNIYHLTDTIRCLSHVPAAALHLHFPESRSPHSSLHVLQADMNPRSPRGRQIDISLIYAFLYSLSASLLFYSHTHAYCYLCTIDTVNLWTHVMLSQDTPQAVR